MSFYPYKNIKNNVGLQLESYSSLTQLTISHVDEMYLYIQTFWKGLKMKKIKDEKWFHTECMQQKDKFWICSHIYSAKIRNLQWVSRFKDINVWVTNAAGNCRFDNLVHRIYNVGKLVNYHARLKYVCSIQFICLSVSVNIILSVCITKKQIYTVFMKDMHQT